MRFLLLFFMLSVSGGVLAQKTYSVQYTINGFTGNKAVLESMYGSKMLPVDSFEVVDGVLRFDIDSGLPVGMYRLVFTDSIFTDIIFNNEDIMMQTEMNNILPAMNVLQSYENMVLFNYWKYAIAVKDSLTRLIIEAQHAIRRDGGTPGKNYRKVENRAAKLRQSVVDYSETLQKMYPHLFAATLLKAYQKPDYNAYMRTRHAIPYPNEKEFYRVHFFSNFNFSHPGLVRTNVIYKAINDYFSNFGDPPSTANYIRNLDFILSQLKAGDEAYEYGLYMFIDNFEYSIYENVYFHLIENHLANYPKADPVILKRHQQHIKLMRSLREGNKAPNPLLTDTFGSSFHLHSIGANAKLIFFWSPGCEHCEELKPDLMEIYEMYKRFGFEVVSFAIVPDEDYWKSGIQNFKSRWINVSDLKGMASPVARDFNVWMTPMLYILDKDNVIRGKPRSLPEIHAKLVELLPVE